MMSLTAPFLLFSVYIFMAHTVSCQGNVCQVPTFRNIGLSGVLAHGVFSTGKQYIIPSTNLSGCGQVARVRMSGLAQGGNGSQDRFLEFQHFRPDRVHSTVFTKVASTVVSARIPSQWIRSASFDLNFQFSSEDVLGFYYPDTANYFGIYCRTSDATHSVLTSVVDAPTSNVVTMTHPVMMNDPLALTLSVNCMECPTSSDPIQVVPTSTLFEDSTSSDTLINSTPLSDTPSSSTPPPGDTPSSSTPPPGDTPTSSTPPPNDTPTSSTPPSETPISDDMCQVPSFPTGGWAHGLFLPGRQYIIPSTNLSGCGHVSSLHVTGQARGGDGAQRLLEFQHFRPDRVHSTVFTKVASTVVAGSGLQLRQVALSIDLNFQFSSGDVLGFYYPDCYNRIGVFYVTTDVSHTVLTSMISSPTSNVVTMTDPTVMRMPFKMSLSVNCKECPISSYPPPSDTPTSSTPPPNETPIRADVCRVSCFPSGVLAHGLFRPGKQYILPSTNLLGCGQIVSLSVTGIAIGGAGVQERFIEFQHFRPDRVHSTVFTKVASTVVSTSVQQSRQVIVSIDVDYQFSSGDVLGFYYPDSVNHIGVYYVTAPVNHPVLTSLVSSLTSNVVTMTDPAAMSMPVYMSLSVNCMECPTSSYPPPSDTPTSSVPPPSDTPTSSTSPPSDTPTSSVPPPSDTPTSSTPPPNETPISADVCRVPSFPTGGLAHGIFTSGKQYIIPSTNLSGCGQVASLRVTGIAIGGAGVQERFIEFQHFRPDRVHSTVFTKVASTIVSTSVQQSRQVALSIDFNFQFSSGDVLGFYYPDSVNNIGVYYVTAPVNHPVLTSLVSSATSNVVTMTDPAVMSMPVYMSLSVNCMDCPTSSYPPPSDTPTRSDSLPLSSSAIGGMAGGGVFLLILSTMALVVISAVCVSVKRRRLKIKKDPDHIYDVPIDVITTHSPASVDDNLNGPSSLKNRSLPLEVITNHGTGATLRDEDHLSVMDTIEADQSNVNNNVSDVNKPPSANNTSDVQNKPNVDTSQSVVEDDVTYDGYTIMHSVNIGSLSPYPSPDDDKAIYISPNGGKDQVYI